MPVPDRPLFDVWPRLAERLPIVELGELPTPVESLSAVLADDARTDAWVKRDDLTSPIYGGNKVRTLEVLFAEAVERRATHVYSTGAYGTNHGTAAVLHAGRAGLASGAVLFPQPPSASALDNLRVLVARCPHVRPTLHWSTLPAGMIAARTMHSRRGERAFVMVPGGATPRGALGYVSAALELAAQVRDGALPAPRRVVVGVGSTCTSAGLLVGFHHAARLGIGFRSPPTVVSVRVTPWPVTSPFRIARLAVRTSELLAERAGDPSLAVGYATLRATLEVDGRQLGRGYGEATAAGRDAIARFERDHGLTLDTTYSAKAAAAVLALARRGQPGPVVFWSTKSTAPLPDVGDEWLERAPPRLRRWAKRAARAG